VLLELPAHPDLQAQPEQLDRLEWLDRQERLDRRALPAPLDFLVTRAVPGWRARLGHQDLLALLESVESADNRDRQEPLVLLDPVEVLVPKEWLVNLVQLVELVLLAAAAQREQRDNQATLDRQGYLVALDPQVCRASKERLEWLDLRVRQVLMDFQEPMVTLEHPAVWDQLARPEHRDPRDLLELLAALDLVEVLVRQGALGLPEPPGLLVVMERQDLQGQLEQQASRVLPDQPVQLDKQGLQEFQERQVLLAILVRKVPLELQAVRGQQAHWDQLGPMVHRVRRALRAQQVALDFPVPLVLQALQVSLVIRALWESQGLVAPLGSRDWLAPQAQRALLDQWELPEVVELQEAQDYLVHLVRLVALVLQVRQARVEVQDLRDYQERLGRPVQQAVRDRLVQLDLWDRRVV